MINESNCNVLAVTDLLARDYPEIIFTLQKICKEENIQLRIISNVNDYWCRDFLPIQVKSNRYVQFVYDPSYYKHPKYSHLKTNTGQIKCVNPNQLEFSSIVLDGGNLVYFENIAIVTDRVFKDNPRIEPFKLQNIVIELLELEKLIVIPAIPYELTGHADGMVRFLNTDTVVVNDFTKCTSKSYLNKLKKSLHDFEQVLLDNNFSANSNTDDATGDYLNHVCIGRKVVFPAYGIETDESAFRTLENCYPSKELVPVSCNSLAKKGGVLHCATWQNSENLEPKSLLEMYKSAFIHLA